MLAVDFDGVVCDGLTECAAITWFAGHDRPGLAGRRLRDLVATVPATFLETFARVRNYSRLMEHFMVALSPAAAAVRDQARFDAVFAALPVPETTRLVRRAEELRAAWREQQSDEWLDLHTLYPGVQPFLTRHTGRTVVITAKDQESVWSILHRHGLALAVTDVVGECTDKASAVQVLAAGKGTHITDVLFIDDNLRNVHEVAATGARAYWAGWGYHTEEHVVAAAARRTPTLRLGDLSALSA